MVKRRFLSEEHLRTWSLTRRLTQRSVSSEFKGTALGRLWSLINPLATVVIFSLIFGVVFRGSVEPGRNSGIDTFALWIGIGVLCWSFLSGAVIKGMDALTSNASLLTKVYFPRRVLVYAAVIALVVDFLFELIVLVAIAMLLGGPAVLLQIPALILVTVLTALFSTGLALVLAILTVYFRDISYLWQIFTQVWMYASGVVFSVSMLDEVQARLYSKGWQFGGEPLPITTLFRLNPAVSFLEAFRSCLYDFAFPSWPVMAACCAWAIGMFSFGLWFFQRHQARIVEEL